MLKSKFQIQYLIISIISIIIFIIPAPYQSQEIVYSNLHIGMQNHNNFELNKYSNYPQKNYLKFDNSFKYNNLKFNVALNKFNNAELNFDRTNIDYTTGNTSFGFGAIDRQWSFSPHSSLILSKNARPAKSIYFKHYTKKKSKYPILSYIGPWSLEIFNALTEVDRGPNKSMLLGVRTTFKPTKRLMFELIQTSQWGGQKKQNGLEGLVSAALLNTNEGENEHVNKMAGFGVSYELSNQDTTLRFYGQAIGEDESGGFPSCYIHMAGMEYLSSLSDKPTEISLELVDTRIDQTRSGYCGKNTAYNNGNYSYTNYGRTMGASIDTEGKSVKLSTMIKLNDALSIKYTLSHLVINDADYNQHRLSSFREDGVSNIASLHFKKNDILNLNMNIYHQNITLDKANISEGVGFSVSTDINF